MMELERLLNKMLDEYREEPDLPNRKFRNKYVRFTMDFGEAWTTLEFSYN